MILPKFPNYDIREDGSIFSFSSRKNMKSDKVKKGHLRCTLTNESGEKKHVFVHRLVAMAFIPNPNNYPMVCHIDSNPENNRVENLRWDDARGNMADRKSRGLYASQVGEKNRSAKLTPWQVMRIRLMTSLGTTQGKISQIMKISRGTISDIVHRRSWSHI